MTAGSVDSHPISDQVLGIGLGASEDAASSFSLDSEPIVQTKANNNEYSNNLQGVDAVQSSIRETLMALDDKFGSNKPAEEESAAPMPFKALPGGAATTSPYSSLFRRSSSGIQGFASYPGPTDFPAAGNKRSGAQSPAWPNPEDFMANLAPVPAHSLTDPSENEQSIGLLRVYVQQLYNENLQLRSQLGLGPAGGGIQKLVRMESSLERILRGYRFSHTKQKDSDLQNKNLQEQVEVMRNELSERSDESSNKASEHNTLQNRLDDASKLVDSLKTTVNDLKLSNQQLREAMTQREDDVVLLDQNLKSLKQHGTLGTTPQDSFALYHAMQESKNLSRKLYAIQTRLKDLENSQFTREQYILHLETEGTRLRYGAATPHAPFSTNMPMPGGPPPMHPHVHMSGPLGPPRGGAASPGGPGLFASGPVRVGGQPGTAPAGIGGPHPYGEDDLQTPRSESNEEGTQQVEQLKGQLLQKDQKLNGMRKDVESIAGKSRALIKALQDKLKVTEDSNRKFREHLHDIEEAEGKAGVLGEEEDKFLQRLQDGPGASGVKIELVDDRVGSGLHMGDFQFPTMPGSAS